MPRAAARGVAALAALAGLGLLVGGCEGRSVTEAGASTAGPAGTGSAGPGSTGPDGTGPDGTGPSAASATPAPPPPPPPTCAERTLAGLDPAARVGQLLMVGVRSGGVPAGTAAALTDVRAGSVLLLGNSSASADAVRAVVDAAVTATAAPPGVGPLVAVDQEGGEVQRLRGPGFSRIPSAARQAELDPAALADAAAGWGAELRAAGVHVDLAPVADVVASELGARNRPIGALRRGYGSDPVEVSTRVAAFVEGMERSGVATSVKHFPGLGAVRGNTDFSTGVVDATTTSTDPALAPFAAGVQAGAALVMMSSATYEAIDPTQQAVFSPTVIEGMVRGDLGFEGVVISDDLGAAAAVQEVPAGERAVRFLRAGGDLVISADVGVARAMAAALLADAELMASRVDPAALRVLQLKGRLGLLTC